MKPQSVINIAKLIKYKAEDDCQCDVHGNPRQAVLLAYIAGIIDGEGSIRINKNFTEALKVRTKIINPGYYAQINLGMVNKEIPDLFRETFGCGNVREERVPERRSIWRYSLTGRFQLIYVLNRLLPYLRIKKEHAETVIDFCENWKTPYAKSKGVDPKELQRREDAFQKMRKLNAVGAAATTKRVGLEKGSDSLNLQETARGKLKCFPATK